jgi:hypothetical protein
MIALVARRIPQTALNMWKLATCGSDKPSVIRAALCVIGRNQQEAVRERFLLWKLAILRLKNNAEIARLEKQPAIIEGFNKIEKLRAKKPRHALKKANKHREHCNKVDDVLKKLMFIYKTGT